jgi:hypothetical protein
MSSEVAVWIEAACGPALVAGQQAHLDATLLSAVDGLGADLVCTHVDRAAAVAGVAMSARVAREPDLAAIAACLGGPATVRSAARPDGRCVRFPGQDRLTGTHAAAEIVADSAIDEVVGIGVPVAAESVVDTRGFLRPTYVDGRLVLLVEPAAGGVLRPAEIAQPHQCCGGH